MSKIVNLFILLFFLSEVLAQQPTYPVVHTNVNEFYNDTSIINAPLWGESFYGQDAHRQINLPDYTDNGDGTVTDNITGLMWQQDMGSKISYSDAEIKADSMTLGGYSDWRVPTIKELYSLIQFDGQVSGITAIYPFIDTNYFIQPIGDTSIGEREIDAQTWSKTHYTGLTMNGDSAIFGVNFIDGRIKGYPKYKPNNVTEKTMYFRMVRSNTLYGQNNFSDNQDGTVTDSATFLMWQQADDGIARDWQGALSYCENLQLAGYNNWHLPHAKELHSIVDYSRSPGYTNSPAIDSLFYTTSILDPDSVGGQYPYFWSSTTHLDGNNAYDQAVYIAFGKAQGVPDTLLVDVHGAGAQRSDPKSGNQNDYPVFYGPQGDVRYVYNYCRCVRNIEVSSDTTSGNTSIWELNSQPQINLFPNPATNYIHASIESPSFEAPFNIRVYDMLGQLQLNQTSNERDFTIQLNTLAHGSYIMIFEDKFNRNIRKKIVVK